MQIDRAGEQAVVLSVEYGNTADCVSAIRQLVQHIEEHPHSAIRSVRPGLDSLLIEHVQDASFEEWLRTVQHIGFTKFTTNHEQPVCVVPVCYEFGDDLPAVCDQTALSREEIVEMHCSGQYQVWMIGFMPGFPYIGQLSRQLQLPRKSNPDPAIPEGSVAIAEEYIGIYPFQSPGGWHVIGRTPWKIIDYNRPVPWTFEYGMNVRFQPISKTEFDRIKNQ